MKSLGDSPERIKTFEDLEVWQVCRELRRQIFEVTSTFPAEERYRLIDQLRRAAVSVTANIAEGYGRYHYQENIQFCRQSRGSLYEILDHLITSADLLYIDKARLFQLRSQVLRSIQLINGYLRMLQRAKAAPIDD